MDRQCPFCGNRNMAAKRVEYLYRDGGRFMVVNDVPCLECEFCGERYFEAAVLKTIERDFFAIRSSDKKPLRTIQVPVEEFAGI